LQSPERSISPSRFSGGAANTELTRCEAELARQTSKVKKLEGELAEAHAMIASQADLLASLEADKASTHRGHMEKMEAEHMKLLANKGDSWPSPSPDPLPAIFGKKGGGICPPCLVSVL